MQASKDGEMQKRRATLEAELANTNDKIRLYRAIEDGIVGLDDQLEDRIETLKNQRDIVVATLERIVTQARTTSAITPERLQKFSRLMHEKLDTGDVQAKKAYLRSVIAQIEVGDDKVRIFGEKASLAAAIAGNPPETAHVRGFVRAVKRLLCARLRFALVAQLDRASDFEAARHFSPTTSNRFANRVRAEG